MTIQTTIRKAGPFLGNGVTTVFPFTFKCFSTSDLQAVKTTTAGIDISLVLNSDYSISLNADQNASPGGSISYPLSGTVLQTGEKLTATGVLSELQQTHITNGGNFFASNIEDQMDYLTILVQQHAEKLARALLGSTTDAAPNLSLGTALQRALKYPSFDANGDVSLAQALPSGTLSQASIISFLGADPVPRRTAAETAAGVTPTNYAYQPGDVRRYGAKVDGATDDTTAVAQAVLQMQQNGAGVFFPGGTCVCQITISGVAVGYVFRGEGLAQTILKAISITADVFKFTAGASVWGLTIEKLQILAVANSTSGSGIHFPTGLNFPPYQVLLRDLYISGFGRSAVYDQAGVFTSRLENVGANNTINHNFDLAGGNTLHLIGCYAHGPTPTTVNFTAGVAAAATSATLTANWAYDTDTYYVTFSSGERRGVTLTNGATTATWSVGLTYAASATAKLCSAGYRVRSGAPDFINCNGIDQGNIWGIFSGNVAEDGIVAYCLPNLINCNIESFAEVGIRNKQGGATFVRTTVLGHAQGVIGTLFEPLNSSLRGTLDADNSYNNTAAAIPVTFTGAPSGTSATLASNWGFASGVWPVTFSDAEVRSVTLTNGATTATWSGALTGSPTASATTSNWRFGYGAHTATAGGAPFSSVSSAGGNSQFSFYAQNQPAVVTQSCVGSPTTTTLNRLAHSIYDLISGGIAKVTQEVQTAVTVTYSASMTPDWSLGCVQRITATDTNAMTINAPTNAIDGQVTTYYIANSSGGVMGAITFGASYKLAGAWTNPATGNGRFVSFLYDSASGHYRELFRSATDVPT